MMIQSFRLFCLLACLCLPLTARAEMRGLIIGVSDYLTLDADLRGPANDVRLMSDMLLARGAEPAEVRVLAAPDVRLDPRLTLAGQPVRAAILAELDRLAAVSAAGDQVVFYFSGHGSQAPDRNGDEGGGYDEILLPADAGSWQGAIGAVENALVDDELGVKMQAILDTGAQVVAIIDACHSATGFRAVPAGGSNGVARYLERGLLGVPVALDDVARPVSAHTTGSAQTTGQTQVAPPLDGDFVFLYASQSDQRSFEFPLGDADEPANWFGDFTRALTTVLAQADGLSWAQVLESTREGMTRDGPAAQTPDAEGPALDQTIFGTAEAAPALWRFENGVLRAGLLHGLTERAEVALQTSVDDATEAGTAVLVDVGADRAALKGDALPASGWARLLRPGLPAALRLAPAVVVDPSDGHDYRALVAAFEKVFAERLVEGVTLDATNPDMQPYFIEGTLALAGRDGVLDPLGAGSTPRLTLDGDIEAAITTFLERAARAQMLRHAVSLASARGGTAFALPGARFSVQYSRVAMQGDCEGEGGAEQALAPEEPLAACDQLWLRLANSSSVPRDVTVLYIDRDFHISALWPEAGLSNRIAKGEAQDVGLQVLNTSNTAALEEVLILSVAAQDGAPRTVLTALADPTGAYRDLPFTALADWFVSALRPTQRTRALGPAGEMPAFDVIRRTVVVSAAK